MYRQSLIFKGGYWKKGVNRTLAQLFCTVEVVQLHEVACEACELSDVCPPGDQNTLLPSR